MANDNYVIRERYNGLVEVDGQLIPQRGEVKPEELVATSPDNEEARNNGGGVYNHNLFFDVLTPASKSVMPDELKQIIEKQYGSLEAFKKEMEKAALSRFGSGWAWLLVQPNGKLTITTTANQDAPFMDVALTEGYPIFNIDVWEHAYYLKYRNKRGDYLANLWKVVDWKQVYSNYLRAIGE